MTQPEAQFRQPQYLREVVRMVAGPDGTVFDDPAKEAALYAGQLSLEELEPYRAMYTAALRVAAVARNISREDEMGDPDYDPQEFNIDWREENFEPQPELAEGLDRLAFGYQVDIRPIAEELQRSKIATWAPRKLLQGVEVATWWGVAREDTPEPEPSRVSARRLRPGKSFEGQELDLLPHQEEYMQDIAAFLETCREQRSRMSPGEKRTAFAQGAVVESPTGSGKTVLIAHALKHEEIGSRPPGEEKKRALIIVPSRELGNQLSRRSGILRSFVPELSVSKYFHHSRDATGDVVVISIESFVKHFKNGRLDGRKFDLTIVEEGHHMMEPQFRQVFTDHVHSPALLLTATPSYSQDKDIRQLFPAHIKHGSLLEYIDAGILNQAQLFKFRIDPRNFPDLLPQGLSLEDIATRREVGSQFIEQAIIDFVTSMVKEGRRGMVFCESGNQSAFARRLAERISGLTDEHGEPIIVPGGKQLRAEAIGTFRRGGRAGKTTNEIIEEYNRGDIQVLTTVEAGREGLDLSDVDFVVIGSPTTSLLRLKQMVGRGLRLSGRFPVTIFAQFTLPDIFRKRDTRHDLYQAFDLEEPVPQGHVIRRSNDQAEHNIVKADRLSLQLQMALESLDDEPISRLGVGTQAEITIPEGYLSLGELAVRAGFSEEYTSRILGRAGYAWIGKIVEASDGGRRLSRFYEPGAAEFMQGKHKKSKSVASPPVDPEPPEDDGMNAVQIATLAGSPSLVRELSNMLQARPDLDQGARRVQGLHAYPKYWSSSTGIILASELQKWVASKPSRHSLAPNQLPLYAIVPFFGMTASNQRAPKTRLSKLGITAREEFLHGSSKSKILCITWSDLQLLEQHYDRAPGMPQIDYRRLAEDEDYARAVQIMLCKEEILGLEEGELSRIKALSVSLFPDYHRNS